MIMTTTATLASERKSGLPMRLRSTTIVGSSHIPLVSRSRTPVSTVMHISSTDEASPSFNVGDRVLVNGLKSGTIRYTGRVQFATGSFCGVELDEPDGKHDGQVNNIRYFQCPANYGVFVPYDKVVPEMRERASSMNRSGSRLKPPTVKRSMTMSAPHSRVPALVIPTRRPAPIPPPSPSFTPTHASIPSSPPTITVSVKPSLEQLPPSRLPDIIPIPTVISPLSSPPPLTTRSIQRRLPPDIPKPKPSTSPPVVPTIEETLETMDADFTDSVSLILHQLQQEPIANKLVPRVSEVISEEGTIDDDDNGEDDFDVLDVESVIEQPVNSSKKDPIERLSSTSSTSTIKDPNKSRFNDISSQMHKAMSNVKKNFFGIKSNKSPPTSMNKPKLIRQDNIKGDNNQLKSIPSATSRRTSLIPPKVISPLVNPLNSPTSTASLASNSKHSSSHSSQSDLPSKVNSTIKRTIEPFGNNRTERKFDTSSEATIEALEHQLMMNRVIIQSLEMSNEQMNKQNQHLLNRFDLMSCLAQFYINENEQRRIQLNKNDRLCRRMKDNFEQQHRQSDQELIRLTQTHQTDIERLKTQHQEQIHDFQQRLDQLTCQRDELEQRCQVLDERVKNFMATLAEDENADVVLATMEKLEKDRTSLQTVIEMRNEELNQLRTKINEQVLQREDQLALQKRIDMAENRNEDLMCLIHQWQLNEKAVVVERDELKEKVAQLERDYQQLIFENEILRYHGHQTSSDSQIISTNDLEKQ